MNPPETSWLPALGVLLLSLIAVAVYVLWARARPASPSPTRPGDALESLQRRVELLMEQLRALDAERHLMTGEAFAAQRERLEAETAAALRARDGHRPESDPAPTRSDISPGISPGTAPGPSPSASAPIGFLAGSPQLKGALWGGGVVLFFVALGLFLGQDNRPRAEGTSATGQTPPMAGIGTPDGDRELEALNARLEQVPDDVEAAARAAHLLLKRQDLDNAEALTQRGLTIDPFHTETRIHRALLRAGRGDPAAAERELIHLVDHYPAAQEGLLYLGMLRLQRGDKRAALQAFERYATEAPAADRPPMLERTLAGLRAEVGGATK